MSGIPTNEIREIVYKIHESTVKNKKAHFKKIYCNFEKKYPNLFEMACSDAMDVKTFEFLLSMMDKVNNNETDQNQASTQVGEKLFSQFVQPNLAPIEPGAVPKTDLTPIINIKQSQSDT